MNVKPVIVQSGKGKDLRAFDNILSVMLSGEQTKGALALMVEWIPPGGGPPPHHHNNEDEIFLVIEGRISYCVEENWIEVGTGGVVYLPSGVKHSYRNIGSVPGRHWIITTPAGFEKFFEECANEFGKTEVVDQGRINQIHYNHGIILIDR